MLPKCITFLCAKHKKSADTRCIRATVRCRAAHPFGERKNAAGENPRRYLIHHHVPARYSYGTKVADSSCIFSCGASISPMRANIRLPAKRPISMAGWRMTYILRMP